MSEHTVSAYDAELGSLRRNVAEMGGIAEKMLDRQNYLLDAGATAALTDYIARRRAQPHFANARSIRNALDRARLRQATRLFEERSRPLTADDLMTIEAGEIRSSRVFDKEVAE